MEKADGAGLPVSNVDGVPTLESGLASKPCSPEANSDDDLDWALPSMKPEVECIGKGKAHRPYEFGVKVSVATTPAHAKGGQFVAHVKAIPGNPL